MIPPTAVDGLHQLLLGQVCQGHGNVVFPAKLGGQPDVLSHQADGKEALLPVGLEIAVEPATRQPVHAARAHAEGAPSHRLPQRFQVHAGLGAKGEALYVEATTAGQTSNPFYRNRNEQDVIDELNLSLSSPHFFIGVDMEGTLKRTLGRGWVPSKFKKLLDAHDPKDVQSLIDKCGLYAAPSERIECGDWTLTGWLVPALEDIQSRGDKSGFKSPTAGESIPLSLA